MQDPTWPEAFVVCVVIVCVTTLAHGLVSLGKDWISAWRWRKNNK